jgi:hypothetical protein
MKIFRVVAVEAEIEDADGIDSLQAVVPFGSALGLLTNGKGGIEDASVLEELLLAPLHLNKELLPLLVLAIDIKHGFAVKFRCAHVFGVQIGQVRYQFPPVEHGIKETDEQILVHLGAEEFFKSEVSVEIDISLAQVIYCHNSLHFRFLFCKVRIFSRNRQHFTVFYRVVSKTFEPFLIS